MFKLRTRQSLGPFRFNISERGLRSTAIKLGIVTYNLTHRQLTINLPGWFYWQSKRQR